MRKSRSSWGSSDDDAHKEQSESYTYARLGNNPKNDNELYNNTTFFFKSH